MTDAQFFVYTIKDGKYVIAAHVVRALASRTASREHVSGGCRFS